MWVSPSPVCTASYLKGKQTLSHLRASSSFRLILQYFRFSLGFPESCTIPKTIAYSCIRNAFPNVQTKRPKPNHIPEAKASLRRQTHAWILNNTPPNTNLCPMPEQHSRILSAYPKPQTSALPEAIWTKEVSWEYGEHHHFQQYPRLFTTPLYARR